MSLFWGKDTCPRSKYFPFHSLDGCFSKSISQCIAAAAAAAKLLQSCLTLCDPIDSSPPGFPVPGIPQARTLEWVAISFSNAWKWKVKVKLLSRVRLLATPWTTAHQAPLVHGIFQARVLEWGAIAFSSFMHKSFKILWESFQEEFSISQDRQLYTFLSFFFLVCHTTCGILVPWLGIKPAPPAEEGPSLNHWTTREDLTFIS